MKLKAFLIGSQAMAVVLSIGVLGGINFYNMHYSVEKEVYHDNKIIANATAEHIAELLEGPVRLLRQIKAVYEAENVERATLNRIVGQLIRKETHFERLEILNDQGVVIDVMPENEDLLDIKRSSQEYFQKIQRGQSIVWSNSFISAETGRPTVLVAIPMKNGVLAGYLDLQIIGNLALKYSDSYGNAVSLEFTDARGTTIAHSDPGRVRQREWSDELFPLHMQSANDRQEKKIVKAGKEYLISVADIGRTGWHVIVYQTAESAFAVLNRIQLFFVLTALLVLVSGTAFSWRKISGAISSLSRMNNKFLEIAAGNFYKQVEPERFAELNEMAGHVNHMIACIRERDKQLEELAQMDVLTGLGNRTIFLEWLRKAVDEARPFALIFLDLDNFKLINDSYGHYRGDQALVRVAEKLQSFSEGKALLARIGGDEFVLIVKDWQGGQGMSLVEKLHDVMAQQVKMDDFVFSTNSSIGISIFPTDSRNADELLRFADLAMYHAKAAGKNCFRFFSLEMSNLLQRKNEIIEALRSQNVFEEFSLHYQPILTADGKTLRGFEALLRWKNKFLGAVPPIEFIPIMEEMGMISEVGRWVLREACSHLAYLCANGNNQLIMSVNVSTLQLKNEEFANHIVAALARCKLPGNQLELEITESAVIDSFQETNNILRTLKKLNVLIALDDFGTGYSSLSYLHELPIDTLKIDRSFISEILENPKSRGMLKGILSLAKQIKMPVIAEGIELVEQADIAREIECDFCQGYLFSKPMPAHETVEYCRKY